MKWTRGSGGGDVEDRRGTRARGRSGAAIGGGAGLIVVLVVIVAKAAGVDLSGLLGGGSSDRRGDPPPQSAPIDPATDPDRELVEYVTFVMKDVQDTFEREVAAQRPYGGKRFRRAKLVLFREAVDTGCGTTSAAVGPFYCPPDEHAYIDLSFYRDLKARFGAPGDFAQAYVIAHEVGHHLQTVFGIAGRGESVKLELQADCFAGVWGHSAAERQLLELGDVEEAIGAASAIGDDRLQKMAGRKVNPETWTHGSSAQRVAWWRRGFESGRFDACDPFAAETR